MLFENFHYFFIIINYSKHAQSAALCNIGRRKMKIYILKNLQMILLLLSISFLKKQATFSIFRQCLCIFFSSFCFVYLHKQTRKIKYSFCNYFHFVFLLSDQPEHVLWVYGRFVLFEIVQILKCAL